MTQEIAGHATWQTCRWRFGALSAGVEPPSEMGQSHSSLAKRGPLEAR